MENTNLISKIIEGFKSFGRKIQKVAGKVAVAIKTPKGIAICSTLIVAMTVTVIASTIIIAKKSDNQSNNETTSMEAEMEETVMETTEEVTTNEATTEETTEETTE